MSMIPVLWLALVIFMIISSWKVYTKAGKPGWACIIPIYNIIVMLEIAEKPIWWIVLLFIPIANLVASILIAISIAEHFGQGAGFGIGLAFIPIVFYPVLAFGSATYVGAESWVPPAAPVEPPSEQPPAQQ